MARERFHAETGIARGHVRFNDWFQKVLEVEPRWNRMVAYPGTVMHSGDIRAPPRSVGRSAPRAPHHQRLLRVHARAVRGCVSGAWCAGLLALAAARAGGGTARGHAAIAGAGRGRRAVARARVYRFDDGRRHPVLYANDGRDMEAVGLEASLRAAKPKASICRSWSRSTCRATAWARTACPTARGRAAWSRTRSTGRSERARRRIPEWLAHTLVPSSTRITAPGIRAAAAR